MKIKEYFCKNKFKNYEDVRESMLIACLLDIRYKDFLNVNNGK